MPFICSRCPSDNNQHPRGISYLRNGVFVEYCRVHDPANRTALTAARNMFEGFTLDNVHDEHGKKVTVNSLQELRVAEKRYNFALAVASDDGGTAATPPQHESWAGDLTHGYEKKWARDPKAYKSEAARKGVSTGVADNAEGTLANRPNPV
jgi:hypothetical protein